MKIKLYHALILALAFVQTASAQNINSFKQVTAKPRLYEKTEFDITLTSDWQNPYLQEDVALDMVLQTPAGKKPWCCLVIMRVARAASNRFGRRGLHRRKRESMNMLLSLARPAAYHGAV
jgi:hypothetical protein